MKNIIVHFPFKIDRKRAAASQIRPIKIIDSFKALQYNVFLVEGYGNERKQQIREIKTAINSGMQFDFVYSECNTTPTLLTEKHHYPTYPFLDYSFFKFCKKNGIPIGLFYRDIYWCFPENNKSIVRKVLKLFYKFDLHEYNQYVSALYVPSHEMVNHIPFKLSMPIHELYPGCDLIDIKNKLKESNKSVNILYVGGIGHNYDVRMIMDVIKAFPNFKLTLCCRLEEWESVKKDYEKYITSNIHIVHKSGKDLESLYSEANLFCLFVQPDKYREFAVPFKLFESIGYGCPILASEGTWVSKFVQINKIGYTCKYDKNALYALLRKISVNQNELSEITSHVKAIRTDNTWISRCETIRNTLISK